MPLMNGSCTGVDDEPHIGFGEIKMRHSPKRRKLSTMGPQPTFAVSGSGPQPSTIHGPTARNPI